MQGTTQIDHPGARVTMYHVADGKEACGAPAWQSKRAAYRKVRRLSPLITNGSEGVWTEIGAGCVVPLVGWL